MKQSKTYIMRDSRSDFYKIGKSKKPQLRERTLSYEIPSIKTIHVFPFDIEKFLHRYFQEKRKRGEWFDLDNENLLLIESLMGLDRSAVIRELFPNYKEPTPKKNLILNRIEKVLKRKERSIVWLSSKMKLSKTTITRWVKNERQPTLPTAYTIAQLLEVEIEELMVSTKSVIAQLEKQRR